MLDALSKSGIRFITNRHEQVSAHSADGYARDRRARVCSATSVRPDQLRDRRRERGARLHSDGGDRGRYSLYYGRHPHRK